MKKKKTGKVKGDEKIGQARCANVKMVDRFRCLLRCSCDDSLDVGVAFRALFDA